MNSALKMDSESEDVSENSVDVPENWDSESEQQQQLDNMEPELEPEQKVFLQRLAEIDQNSCAAVSHGPVAAAANSRFNFGLEQKEGGERSLLMSRWKNDKGYAGVVNRSPSNERKQRINSRKKENNNRGTDRHDKGKTVAKSNTIPDENARLVTVSRSNSNKSTGEKVKPLSRANSPSFGTVMQQLEPSNKPSASSLGITPLGKSSDKPSTFTLPTTLGKVQSTSVLGNSESKSTSAFTMPAQLKPNDKPSTVTLPTNIISTTSEYKSTSSFEIPSLGKLSDKPSTFTLPTNLAQVKSTSVQSTSSLGMTSLSKPSTFTLPTSLGQLPSNLGVKPEAMSLSKLGDVTSKGGFTIPPLLSSTKTTDQKIQSGGITLSSLANLQLGQPSTKLTDGSTGKMSLSSLANLHLSTAPPSTSSFTLPSLAGPLVSATVREPSPELDIDLSLALKLNNVTEEQPLDDDSMMPAKALETIILADLTNIRSTLRLNIASSTGKVVCKRWRRRNAYSPLQFRLIVETDIERFAFDEPSPDDVVKKAQGQSRSFANRQSPTVTRKVPAK